MGTGRPDMATPTHSTTGPTGIRLTVVGVGPLPHGRSTAPAVAGQRTIDHRGPVHAGEVPYQGRPPHARNSRSQRCAPQTNVQSPASVQGTTTSLTRDNEQCPPPSAGRRSKPHRPRSRSTTATQRRHRVRPPRAAPPPPGSSWCRLRSLRQHRQPDTGSALVGASAVGSDTFPVPATISSVGTDLVKV